MTPEDVLSVYALDQVTDPAPWSEKVLADCLKVGYDCWVMVDNLIVVGFGILSYAATEAHLLKIGIHPDHQGVGLGQKMLQHLIKMATNQGADEMFLEVRISNTRAITLYEKAHFVEVGVRKGYYPGDELQKRKSEDALTMALPLWWC